MLIFVSYFYFAVRDNPERNTHLIPISGRVYVDRDTEPTAAQLKAFTLQFIKPALERRPFSRVVLVDHSHSGQSIDSFRVILTRCRQYLPSSLANLQSLDRPVFINLVDVRQGDAWIINPKQVHALIRVEIAGAGRLVALANGAYQRLLPHFQRWKWDGHYDDLTIEGSPDVRERIIAMLGKSGDSRRDPKATSVRCA